MRKSLLSKTRKEFKFRKKGEKEISPLFYAAYLDIVNFSTLFALNLSIRFSIITCIPYERMRVIIMVRILVKLRGVLNAVLISGIRK